MIRHFLSRQGLRLAAVFVLVATTSGVSQGAQLEPQKGHPTTLELSVSVREKALQILRDGLHCDEFWPAIHAAEGLTLAGSGDEVRRVLEPKLVTEADDQRRCGLARELVRAGARQHRKVMLSILAGDNPHGHIHAAEGLFKVSEIGDGVAMRRAFTQAGNIRLRIMAAAALTRSGNLEAHRFLRETLNNPDPEIARLAAWVLGRTGDQSDISRLAATLQGLNDPLAKVFFEHSLAALGAPAGKEALLRNLKSDDPAVRTYAATFAGDACMLEAAPLLIRQLDDSALDARIRAAQTLLQLSHPSNSQQPAD